MNGLELSRAYYEQYGEPMLRERFPQLMPLLAAGLAGSGSECWGYDDEISRDHDFEPGFSLFLPGEDVVDRRTAFALERAYAALPKEFMGLKRAMLAPVGGARHGVLRTADFFREKTGSVDGNLSLMEWLALPEYLLAEAVNGEIFADGLGEVTAIRDRLRHRPADVRLKKLAGQLLLMGQSGQYNYRRCLLHGETGAAQLAVAEFVKSAMAAVFLLNDIYQPYYKWSFSQALHHCRAFGIPSDDGQRRGDRVGKICRDGRDCGGYHRRTAGAGPHAGGVRGPGKARLQRKRQDQRRADPQFAYTGCSVSGIPAAEIQIGEVL